MQFLVSFVYLFYAYILISVLLNIRNIVLSLFKKKRHPEIVRIGTIKYRNWCNKEIIYCGENHLSNIQNSFIELTKLILWCLKFLSPLIDKLNSKIKLKICLLLFFFNFLGILWNSEMNNAKKINDHAINVLKFISVMIWWKINIWLKKKKRSYSPSFIYYSAKIAIKFLPLICVIIKLFSYTKIHSKIIFAKNKISVIKKKIKKSFKYHLYIMFAIFSI